MEKELGRRRSVLYYNYCCFGGTGCGVFVTNRAYGEIGFIDWFDVHFVGSGGLDAVHLEEMRDAGRKNVGLQRLVAQNQDLLMERNQLRVNMEESKVLRAEGASRAPSTGSCWLGTWSRGKQRNPCRFDYNCS